ncbi:hypothetical protein RHGRI_020974 [Rhododendron griersonianum]|uniref:Uncharacterized protein n=1 Tax=Rhododendron griersonianum TaxID=479676 RepID=A0AAV6JIA8_9ERIC|nr:hypothetical protein RHGRI_020974 [Rhododendron griersonianum]
MANFENPDDYDHDIYDEENWDNDDPYGGDPYDGDPYDGDPYDGDPYDAGEGSSDHRPRRANARMRRAAVGICNIHHDTYMCKEPCRTSALTGKAWVTELEEGNPKRMRPNFLPSDRGVETTAPNGNHGSRVQRDDRDMDAIRASMRDFIMENNIR